MQLLYGGATASAVNFQLLGLIFTDTADCDAVFISSDNRQTVFIAFYLVVVKKYDSLNRAVVSRACRTSQGAVTAVVLLTVSVLGDRLHFVELLRRVTFIINIIIFFCHCI